MLGKAIASVAHLACAPIAAMSETLTASAFHPISYGAASAKKCVPATDMSVETTSCMPSATVSKAASSPTPKSVCLHARVKYFLIKLNSEVMAYFAVFFYRVQK